MKNTSANEQVQTYQKYALLAEKLNNREILTGSLKRAAEFARADGNNVLAAELTIQYGKVMANQ